MEERKKIGKQSGKSRKEESAKEAKREREKASAERGREGGEVGRVLVWKKDGLARKGFGWFSQKTGRMERGRGERGERGERVGP